MLQRTGYAAWSMFRTFSSLLVVSLVWTATLAAAISQTVQVQVGAVAGVPGREPSITVFKGIPFAAPPVVHFHQSDWFHVLCGSEFIANAICGIARSDIHCLQPGGAASSELL